MNAAAWDALDHGPSPFTEHGFLRALERSGSVGAEAGWQPVYVLVEAPAGPGAAAGGEGASAQADPRRLVGAVAAYIKPHSYGEYIFDWSWARGARQAGIRYYPKLVIAAPMTPATGRRLLIAPDVERAPVVAALIAAIRGIADAAECSSIHWLFCGADEQRELAAAGYTPRASFQYHWRNHGYADFDGFLGELTSRRRKQVRKERARAQAAIDGLDWVAGGDLKAAEIAALDGFYRRTTFEHGGFDYLRPGFFERLVELAPGRVEIARVRRGGEMIAGALFLETPKALYGRYWGCSEAIEFLHFETTCYAGIDRCIARQIPLFEAGAQGQHKLLRGFLPAPTYSAHWIRHPGLRQAIQTFCREEAIAVAAGMDELAQASPFRAEVLAARRGAGAG
ncbi:MAG: GNAT family N-acetyltransferase [Myxococcales bacterium]|nr:GNAT family N-acetyltransferase [Myxococcales bacterium]